MRQSRRIDVHELARALESEEPPAVLDVRTPAEHSQGAIPSSLLIPLNELAARADEVPRDRSVVVHCRTGYRSAAAASILEARGFDNVIDLRGGFEAFRGAAV